MDQPNQARKRDYNRATTEQVRKVYLEVLDRFCDELPPAEGLMLGEAQADPMAVIDGWRLQLRLNSQPRWF